MCVLYVLPRSFVNPFPWVLCWKTELQYKSNIFWAFYLSMCVPLFTLPVWNNKLVHCFFQYKCFGTLVSYLLIRNFIPIYYSGRLTTAVQLGRTYTIILSYCLTTPVSFSKSTMTFSAATVLKRSHKKVRKKIPFNRRVDTWLFRFFGIVLLYLVAAPKVMRGKCPHAQMCSLGQFWGVHNLSKKWRGERFITQLN